MSGGACILTMIAAASTATAPPRPARTPAVASWCRPSEKETERVRAAMNEMRRIAIAIEQFAIANNRYPVPARSAREASADELAPLADVVSHLKRYDKKIALADPWGHAFLYWSSGTHYVLVCLGSDGILTDEDAVRVVIREARAGGEAFRGRETTCPEDEIVFADGAFVQYPIPSGSACGSAKPDIRCPSGIAIVSLDL